MGQEQARAQVLRQRQQVVVGPGGGGVAVQAGLVAFAVPADAEAVAIRHHLRLFGAQRLVHQRVTRFGDELFQEERLTDVGG